MRRKPRIRLKSIIYISLMALILALGCVTPGIHCIQPVDHSEPISGDILNPKDVRENVREIVIYFIGQISVDADGDEVFTEVTQENEDAEEIDLMQIGDRITFQDELGTDIVFSTDWVEFDPPVLKLIPDGPFTLDRNYTILLPSASERLIRLGGEDGARASMDFQFSFKTREPDGTKPTLLEISAGGVTLKSPSSSEYIDLPLPPNMDVVIKFSEEMNPLFGFIFDPEITEENILNLDSITSDNITFTIKLTGLDIGKDLYFRIISTDNGVAGLPMAAVPLGEENFWEEAQNKLKSIFGEDFEIADPLDYTKSLPPCRDASGEPLSFYDENVILVPRGFEVYASLARVRIDSPKHQSCLNSTVFEISGIAYVGDEEYPEKNVNSIEILINGIPVDPNVIPDVSGSFSSTADLADIDDMSSYEGPLIIRANADADDGLGGYDEITVIRDITPPVLAITYPTPGSYIDPKLYGLAGYIKVEGTVDDFTEEVNVNGYIAKVSPDETTSDPDDGSFSVTIDLMWEGPHTIEAVATDCAGNQSSTAIVVYRDTVPPQIIVDFPIAGSFINTSRIVVSGVVEDITSGAKWVKVNGEDGTLIDDYFTATVTAPDGPFTITVTASDRAGHISTESIEVTVDTVPPQIQIISPADGVLINSSNVIVSGTVSEPFPSSGIASVIVNGVMAPFDGGSFTAVLTSQPVGDIPIIATAVDNAGNSSIFSINIIIGPDNEWVCLDPYVCEYQDITSALEGENNTGNTIYLKEPNYVFNINNTATYNLTGIIAIQFCEYNQTLDCNDSEIKGNYQDWTHGIIVPYDNATIQNCRITDFGYGISIEGGNNAVITSSTIYHSYSYGIYIRGNGNNIVNNTITDVNSYHCIASYPNSDSSNITDNILTDCRQRGIHILGDNATIENNEIKNTKMRGIEGIFLNGDYANIENNHISGEGEFKFDYGIVLIEANYNDLINNSIYISDYRDLLISSNSNDNNIWLNNFYSKGVTDLGTNNNFCLNNKGNFYEEGISPIYLGTDDCGPTEIIYPDGGYSWFETGNLAGAEGVWSLLQTADGEILAGTVPGFLYRSTDGGNTWSVLYNFKTMFDYTAGVTSLLQTDDGAIYAAVDSVMIFCGPDGCIVGSSGKVYKSTGGGVTWSDTDLYAQVGIKVNGVEALIQADDGAIFAGTGPDGYIFKYDTLTGIWTNAGKLGGTVFVDSLLKTVDGTIYAGSENGVYKYDPSANDWIKLSEDLEDIYSLLQAADGTIFAGAHEIVFISTDGGDTWTETSGLEGQGDILSLIQTLEGASYGGTDEIYAGTEEGIFRYDDLTGMWFRKIEEAVEVFSLIQADDGTIYAGGDIWIEGTGFEGLVFKSIDGGETIAGSPLSIKWTEQSSSNPISYQLYYSNNLVDSWTYIDTTTSLNYSWDITELPNQGCQPVYLVKVVPNDGLYNATNDQSANAFTLCLDKSPIISITFPTDGAYINSPTIVVSGTMNDPIPSSGIASVKVNEVEAYFNGGSFTATLTIQPEGSLTIIATATDNTGNSADSLPVRIMLDITPPIITITSPSEGDFVGELFAVTGSVSDAFSGVSSVTVAGKPAELDLAENTFMAVLHPLDEGPLTIIATATDNAGNSVNTAPVRVIVETEPPVIIITSPADGEYVGQTVVVKGTASDSGAGDISLMVNNESAEVDASQFTATLTGLTGGAQTLIAIGSDSAGNTASSSVTVIVEISLPSLSISSPSEGQFIGSIAVTVSGSVADLESGVAQVMVNGIMAQLSSDGFITEHVPLADEGPTTITAIASDFVGNQSFLSIIVQRDTTPPEMTVTKPAHGSMIFTSTPLVSVTYSDELSGVDTSSFSVFINGNDLTSLFTITPSEASFQIDPGDPLPEGQNIILTSITDLSGNIVQKTSVFNIDLSPPLEKIVIAPGGVDPYPGDMGVPNIGDFGIGSAYNYQPGDEVTLPINVNLGPQTLIAWVAGITYDGNVFLDPYDSFITINSVAGRALLAGGAPYYPATNIVNLCEVTFTISETAPPGIYSIEFKPFILAPFAKPPFEEDLHVNIPNNPISGEVLIVP